MHGSKPQCASNDIPVTLLHYESLDVAVSFKLAFSLWGLNPITKFSLIKLNEALWLTHIVRIVAIWNLIMSNRWDRTGGL